MANYRKIYFDNNPSKKGWYTCASCGKKIRKSEADIDHIIPQKYVKIHKEFNLQCLCIHCNRSKQAKMDSTLPDLGKSAVRIVKREVVKSVFKK